MTGRTTSSLDKALARVCVRCPLGRRARKQQGGFAFRLVQRVEAGLCPFCRDYERAYGLKAHEHIA